jgi:hypothetical protein
MVEVHSLRLVKTTNVDHGDLVISKFLLSGVTTNDRCAILRNENADGK